MKNIHNYDYKQLLTALVDHRKLQKLTQVQVAEHLHKPQSYISKIEQGERRIDILEFVKLCNAINASPCFLLEKMDPIISQEKLTMKEIA